MIQSRCGKGEEHKTSVVSFCLCVVAQGLRSASPRSPSVLAPAVLPAAARSRIPESPAHSSRPWLLFCHLRLEVGREADKAVTALHIISFLYTSNDPFLGSVHRISQLCLFSSHPFTRNAPSAHLAHLTPSGAGHLEGRLFLAASYFPFPESKLSFSLLGTILGSSIAFRGIWLDRIICHDFSFVFFDNTTPYLLSTYRISGILLDALHISLFVFFKRYIYLLERDRNTERGRETGEHTSKGRGRGRRRGADSLPSSIPQP